MNQLATAIQANSLTGTAAEIVTALNADVTLATDSAPYTWSGLGQKLLAKGVDPGIVLNAPTIIGALPNGGAMLNACLTSGGFDCSDAINRNLLVASEITDPPEAVAIVEAMLAIGMTTGKLWEQAGLPSLPEEADVTAALAEIANQTPPVYDRTVYLLSLNKGPTNTAFSFVVRPSTADGQTTDPIKTIASGDVSNATLSEADRTFADALLELIGNYCGSL